MLAKLIENARPVALHDVYCQTLLQMMEEDPRIVQIEADLAGAMGSQVIGQKFPDRYFNCGIMEGHEVGLGCGMSVNGHIPFVHSFTSFITRRAADQIFMSGCYAGANAKLIGTDPGICAETNGGTHMAFEDIGITRCMAGMTILDVADPVLLRSALHMMRDTQGMMYLRMRRPGAIPYYAEDNTFEIGKGKILREGTDVSIIASGVLVVEALRAAKILEAKSISARVVDMFTIKPIDLDLVRDCAEKTGCIVTAENHNVIGGLGSAVAEALAETVPAPMARIGAQDRVGEVGEFDYLIQAFHMTAEDIAQACEKTIARKKA